MTNILAAVLIAGTLLTSSPVKAETITDANGLNLRAVEHADLDLATPDGRTMLKRRIALALESVCGSYAGRTADEQRDVTICRRAANAKLEPQVAKLLAARAPVQSAMADR